MEDSMRPKQSCMPYRSYEGAGRQLPGNALRSRCAAPGGRVHGRSAPEWISPTPEETCPAGLLIGGGLAVASAVPAGPWLTLMCLSRALYFTSLEIFRVADHGFARPDPGRLLIAV